MTQPQLTILYFAALRERMGRDRDQLPLSALGAAPTVASLWAWLEAQQPSAASWRAHVRVAVNHDFASPDAALRPGDEVALIPPVSGGQDPDQEQTLTDPTGCFVVTTQPLRLDQVEALVLRPEAGAVVSFTGRVRDHTGDRQVAYLIYEVYAPMALKKLIEVAQEAHERWPRLRVAIHHRYGRLELGCAAVLISVSSPHRADAFAACQHVIDRLKQVVPIWKKEVGPDGQQWVGFGP